MVLALVALFLVLFLFIVLVLLVVKSCSSLPLLSAQKQLDI